MVIRNRCLDRQIGERLKQLRNQLGLRQWQVAEIVGITRSAYTYYELGRCALPLERVVQLAQLYHTTTDYILGVCESAAISHRQVFPQNGFSYK